MISEGIFLGLAAALCWGISDIFAKIASTREENFVPIHIAGFFGLANMLIINLLFPPAGFPLFTIIYSMMPVGFFMALGWWLFYLSLQKGKISIQSAIGASYGLMVLAGGILFLGETPTLQQIFGGLAIIVSVFFLSLQKLGIRNIVFDNNALKALGAMLCWGIAFILLVPFAKSYPPQIAVLSHTFYTFVFVMIFILVSKKKLLPSKKRSLIPAILASVDSIGLFVYYSAAATFFTSLLAPVSSIYPVFTYALAYVFLGERLKRFQLASVAGILFGIMLISL